MRWLARGESDIPAGWGWLTEVEARRASGMRFTKRRTEYLLRRLAGKAALAATLGLPEDPATLGRIGLLNAPTGAPFAEVDGRRVDLDVSLTDRAGWAVCLVGPDLTAVGCDLEIVEPRSPGFVRDFLTPPEQDLVAGAGDPHAMANLIWSAKESALKVLRTGLRADTRTVEVVPADPDAVSAAQPGWRALTVLAGRRELPGWWRRDGVFLLTVAAPAARPAPGQLPGSAALERAAPIHSWVARPIAEA